MGRPIENFGQEIAVGMPQQQAGGGDELLVIQLIASTTSRSAGAG
jgi:hypothetical protein